MKSERFFRDPRLPWLEVRSSQGSARSFKAHLHRTFSVGGVQSGQVAYQVGDQTALLQPGSLALINPETLHSCNSIGGQPRNYAMLYLEVSWCLAIQQSLWPTAAFVPAQQLRLDDPELYQWYFHTVTAVLDETVDLLAKEQLLLELLGTIFSRAWPQIPANRPIDKTQMAFTELKEMLAANLREDLSLADLATRLGCNPYTLLRQFKAATGITPHAFRTNCRIEQARRYLQQGMDIGETALECGFFDQSHLHRHFKAMTTITPKEYQVNFIQ